MSAWETTGHCQQFKKGKRIISGKPESSGIKAIYRAYRKVDDYVSNAVDESQVLLIKTHKIYENDYRKHEMISQFHLLHIYFLQPLTL